MKKNYLAFALSLMLVSTLSAQKIKIKKDQVYIDKDPAFEFVKLAGSLNETFSWALVKTDRDTSVTFRGIYKKLPKLPFETGTIHHLHYDVYFAGNETPIPHEYGAIGYRKKMVDQLVTNGIVNEKGEVQPNMLTKFAESDQETPEEIAAFQEKADYRQQLLEMPNWVEYMGDLKWRNPDNPLEINGKYILIGGIKVGYFMKKSDTNYGTLYRIFSTGNNGEIATMFYEKDKARTFIRTLFDNGEHEYYREIKEVEKPINTGKGLLGKMAASAAAQEQAKNQNSNNDVWFNDAIEFLIKKHYL